MTRHAERIITNGRLITFDAAQPAAEAIAVANGEIIAVGSAEDVSNLKARTPSCMMPMARRCCRASSKVTCTCFRVGPNLTR
jgi:hypothetical protein